MLLLILEAIGARRREGGDQIPIPIRLPLASWNAQQQTLAAWIALTLQAQAPQALPAHTGQTHQVLEQLRIALTALRGAVGNGARRAAGARHGIVCRA